MYLFELRQNILTNLVFVIKDLSHLVVIWSNVFQYDSPGGSTIGMSNLASKLDLKKSQICPASQNVLKLILKCPRFVPFGANLIQF